MNKTILVVSGVITAGFALFALIIGFWLVGTYNDAATLRNQYDSRVFANQAHFDGMWKKVQQAAQVPEAQKNAFREIFEGYAKARTSEGQGRMMAWIKEVVPNVDLSLYKTLMNIIVGSRDEWTGNQIALVDISREYNQKLSVFPGNFILPMMGFQKIVPKVITSTRTENAFATGKDDEVSLPIGKK